jgi:hypothetical protein
MTRIASNRDAIKEITAIVKEDFELPTKYMNKLIATKFKGDIDKLEGEASDFQELYAKVIK